MKKTAISLLLAVVMVFSLVLVAAPAAQATAHTHCACGGATVHSAAAHTCADTTYTALDQATANAIEVEDASATNPYYPIQGTYYLTENVTIDGRVRIVGDLDICLNGFELKCQYFRFKSGEGVTATNYEVNISDCSANKTGKLTGTVKQLFFNSSDSAVPATINIWGGTISDTATDSVMGHLFQLGAAKDGVNKLNIYGGTLVGGNVTNQGGVMRVSGKTEVNIYGGTISGGTATSTASKSAQGGNIYMTTAGTKVNIYGGSITGGTAAVGTEEGAKTAMGGNIYVGNGELTLYGGTITGGTAPVSTNIHVGGTINIVSVDGTVAFTTTAAEKVVTDNKAANITVTNTELEYTITKTAAGGNANTGDSANLVVMGLGLVLGVAGMACLLPKKQKV